MPIHIETTHLSTDYKIHSKSGEIRIHETLREAHLNTIGAHVIFDKEAGQACVEINALLDQHKALCAIQSLRSVLLDWQDSYAPQAPSTPLNISALALAIWTDLERATSSAQSLHAALMSNEKERIQKAKWLEELPHRSPLLLLGTPAQFFDYSEDRKTLVGHILLLDTSKGAPALTWPDGSHWRDFRPSREDNSAQLATRNALEAASSDHDILIPDGIDNMTKRAEVISRMHGKGPRASRPDNLIFDRLPSLNDWMQGFS